MSSPDDRAALDVRSLRAVGDGLRSYFGPVEPALPSTFDTLLRRLDADAHSAAPAAVRNRAPAGAR